MGVAVPPSVPGARVDGGLDSRLRGNDDLSGARVDGGLDSRLRGKDDL